MGRPCPVPPGLRWGAAPTNRVGAASSGRKLSAKAWIDVRALFEMEHRKLSALTRLQVGDSQVRDRYSYAALAEELRRVSADPQVDAHELFTCMAFNALISNCDDHPRNRAILPRR